MLFETHSEYKLIISLSQRILFGKKLDIYTDTQLTWNDDMKRTTKQVDKYFYLAIHQVSLTGILKVLWTCSVYRLDFVVFVCNMCQWTNVSEALSSVH